MGCLVERNIEAERVMVGVGTLRQTPGQRQSTRVISIRIWNFLVTKRHSMRIDARLQQKISSVIELHVCTSTRCMHGYMWLGYI